MRYNIVFRPDETCVVPVAGGSFKARAIRWLGRFRNQILLYAPVISATGFWIFAGLGEWSYPSLFVGGILAGILLSAYFRIWYVSVFDEVVRDGPVILLNRYDASKTPAVRIIPWVPIVIMTLVFLGVVPGVNLAMATAAIAGFVFILMWGMVVTIWQWESARKKILHFDGMILELEREMDSANLPLSSGLTGQE